MESVYILGGVAILAACATGIAVWLIKRSEAAATRAADDRAGAVEDSDARRRQADEVGARPLPRGAALVERLRNRRSRR